MDLYKDAEVIVRHELDQMGVAHADAKDLEEVLHLLINRQMKGVSHRPRKVSRTSVFDQKNLTLEPLMLKAAAAIITKIENGEDLSGHLSKSSTDAEKMDGLLADWGIHHLHISDDKKNPGDAFYRRTGPVLFVLFREDDAYLIDIFPHGSKNPEAWTRIELLTLVKNTWPELIEPFRLQGFQGVTRQISDLDRKDLREGGVMVPIEIDGAVYMSPGGGVTTAGTSLEVGLAADRLMMQLRDAENELKNMSAYEKTKWAAVAKVRADSLDFLLERQSAHQWNIVLKGTKVAIYTMTNPLPI